MLSSLSLLLESGSHVFGVDRFEKSFSLSSRRDVSSSESGAETGCLLAFLAILPSDDISLNYNYDCSSIDLVLVLLLVLVLVLVLVRFNELTYGIYHDTTY